MKIRFLTTFKPQGNAPDIPTYESGKSYDFSGPVNEGYARKYISRGLAEAVEQRVAPTAPMPIARLPAPEPESAHVLEPAKRDPLDHDGGGRKGGFARGGVRKS